MSADIIADLYALLRDFPNNSIRVSGIVDDIKRARDAGDIERLVAANTAARKFMAEVRDDENPIGDQVTDENIPGQLTALVGECLATAYGKPEEAGTILLSLAAGDPDLSKMIVDAGVRAVIGSYLKAHPNAGIGKPMASN